ncbi:hypothetical protein [Streptomyces aureoversilis]|uniref:Lipoprotein n=1 Tax=Streptomyces aureoversilis TaxID=67277 RepID=A0ABV9ZWJ2_9ACTN
MEGGEAAYDAQDGVAGGGSLLTACANVAAESASGKTKPRTAAAPS